MPYVAAEDRYDQHAVQALRYERARAPGDLARVVAQLRWGSPDRDRAGDRAARLRPRGHALRPREQLRPSLRLGGGELRPPAAAKTCGPYRDELVISTKAGYDMWPGPYGDGGSRKYLLASLDQSLDRLGLEYVDIFYSHRLDSTTPLEETMGALASAVSQGKALYVGISSYSAAKTREAAAILARPRHAAPHPPAVVLAAEPVDRTGPRRGDRRARESGASRSRHSRRAFSPIAT